MRVPLPDGVKRTTTVQCAPDDSVARHVPLVPG